MQRCEKGIAVVPGEPAKLDLEEIKRRCPSPKAAILTSLHIAQEKFGWLSPEAYAAISNELGVPAAALKGVGSFYSMFKHRPAGRHVIYLCTNISCMILGAGEFVRFLREKYGLVPGGTTADGRLSLVIAECIGACGAAPAMMVNDVLYEDLTEEKVEAVLGGCR